MLFMYGGYGFTLGNHSTKHPVLGARNPLSRTRTGFPQAQAEHAQPAGCCATSDRRRPQAKLASTERAAICEHEWNSIAPTVAPHALHFETVAALCAGARLLRGCGWAGSELQTFQLLCTARASHPHSDRVRRDLDAGQRLRRSESRDGLDDHGCGDGKLGESGTHRTTTSARDPPGDDTTRAQRRD